MTARLLTFFILLVLLSCHSRERKTTTTDTAPPTSDRTFSPPPAHEELIPFKANPQIADYIRNMHQDSKGGFWLGTNGRGVAYYDGDTISYHGPEKGFGGYQVTGITEDRHGSIWFATDQGVVRYSGEEKAGGEKLFESSADTLINDKRFWSIHADGQGRIWAGSSREILVHEDGSWRPFSLPYPELGEGSFITATTAWSITEDAQGHLWFSTNGYGVYKYDGSSFAHYDKKDGLADNSVDVILAASNGDMWFGTRHGGVSWYDGERFTNYTALDSIGDNEVCALLEDATGDIWFSAEGHGVYRHQAGTDNEGPRLTNYSVDQGLGVKAVQVIYQDAEGRLWAGGGGGLYRMDGERFRHVGVNGPWR